MTLRPLPNPSGPEPSPYKTLPPSTNPSRHASMNGAPHAAVDSSIRSTTGMETPSSACTRRSDEISMDGNSSKSWPEQLRRGATAAAWWPTAAAASEEREAAEWVL
ncbi:hypothetical protein F511_33495 [Dorcoceras hygrometricum]|uniref:Uncharacterized protein n=1 Tax=Dorcoceras hygrometricum TaxID=472368 RepID=A0A2Z7DBQ3_9LAMI|nr:hypothetical protein F511_33495 [Dorcoceras hygrometricum]